MRKPIDLRSDFVSRPSEAMIEAMVEAARRAGSYGMREDRDQQELEQRAADLLQQEDALFFPTCTMANQAAIRIHCRPGDLLLAEGECHILTAEADATASVGTVTPCPLEGVNGRPTSESLAAALEEGLSCDAMGRASLLVVENTHNRAGGTVLQPSEQQTLADIAIRHGVVLHIDGARIWNAAAYLGCPVANLTCGAASIAASLNKGLGAPMGAVLAGSRPLIEEAERIRMMLGGGWRPTGIVAAAALPALDGDLKRLVDDHVRTRRLAETLAGLPGLCIDLDTVQTNIVMIKVDQSRLNPGALMASLADDDVLALFRAPDRIRMVVHTDVGDEEINAVGRSAERAVSLAADH